MQVLALLVPIVLRLLHCCVELLAHGFLLEEVIGELHRLLMAALVRVRLCLLGRHEMRRRAKVITVTIVLLNREAGLLDLDGAGHVQVADGFGCARGIKGRDD